jgi:hypothetical protein
VKGSNVVEMAQKAKEAATDAVMQIVKNGMDEKAWERRARSLTRRRSRFSVRLHCG